MEHKTLIKIPSKTIERVLFVTCDICNDKIENNSFDIDEVTIKHKTGYLYPEGGQGEYKKIDMCGKCFNQKLLPFLESIGATPSITQWEC